MSAPTAEQKQTLIKQFAAMEIPQWESMFVWMADRITADRELCIRILMDEAKRRNDKFNEFASTKKELHTSLIDLIISLDIKIVC